MNTSKIEIALVDLLADQVIQTTFAGCALITLVGIAMSFSYPMTQVITWVLIGYVCVAPRSIIIKRAKSTLLPDSPRTSLEIVIAFTLFISGLHWGAGAWMFLDINNVQDFALMCGAILGVIASALAIYSTRPLICCIFTFTVFSFVTVKLALVGSWGLAVMCLVVLPPYAILSRTLGRRIEKSVTQDFRNAELLEEVRDARDASEKANREKSLFMTATSHDLRQPLHAQSMYLQIMSSRAKGTEFGDIVDKMMVSNDSLIALFNSLLEVSQLDAGTIEVKASHHSLMETASLVVEEFKEAASNKGLTIELIGHDCIVYSDPILLTRILRNLVSNAIKFTSKGGVILKMTKEGSFVHVSVSDTGVGIPESEQSTIFNEYTQLGNLSRDRSKGIGLGLALVRRMCELLKLELTVESKLGEGSCFRFTVPAGDTANIVKFSQESFTNDIENLDILIIDDEQAILDAMNSLFLDWSCRTRTFPTLVEAHQVVAETKYCPDLIISDYRLNEMSNGIDAISQLRQALGEDVPAIVITGDTDPRLLEKIQNEDFYLLHKPVNVAKLRKVISSLLKYHVHSQV